MFQNPCPFESRQNHTATACTTCIKRIHTVNCIVGNVPKESYVPVWSKRPSAGAPTTFFIQRARYTELILPGDRTI
eukprot:m.516705 g.516705  ORF g.516705 m.516705 type:complete len:76 (-) comp21931_c0_seq1:128-355(-)